MSGQVDLSQIRGDWFFHINYLVNAIEQTIARQNKLKSALGSDDGGIGPIVDRQHEIWKKLSGKRDDKGAIPTKDELVQQFIDVSQETKAPCDAWEEKKNLSGSTYITDTPEEQFTESCRQIRSLCEDLIMMRDQDPR